MIKHINNVWNNIHEWWYDDKTQGNIKKFNMELNIPFKNSEKFTNFFKKEI